MKLSVSYDVDKQYDAFLLRRELVGLREEQLATSELSLRIAEQKFASGTLSQFDFRDVRSVISTRLSICSPHAMIW